MEYNGLIKRHRGTLLRGGRVLEAERYKRDSEGMCRARVRNRGGGEKCESRNLTVNQRRPGECTYQEGKKTVALQHLSSVCVLFH